MSEQQNAALIQSLYEAFAKGDVNFILSRLTEDVEWNVEGPANIPYCGKRKGPAEVQGFFVAIGAQESNQQLTMSAPLATGDRVACNGRYRATVIATGKTYDTPVAHFFTVRDGKISRMEETMDTARIAEAYPSAASATRG